VVLNFPHFQFNIRKRLQKTEIFDIIRKKFVKCTPEELVRQHVLHYLTNNKATPEGLISVERSLNYNGLTKRADIVVYNRMGEAAGLIECKAPEIKLNDQAAQQIAVYNLSFKVKYLWITNGLAHHFYCVDQESRTVQQLDDWPDYELLK
jgi:type I site-specific restriction endonuclease